MATSMNASLIWTFRSSGPCARSLCASGDFAYARRTLDHFKLPVAHPLAPVGQLVAPVGRVSPDCLQPWDNVVQSGQQTAGALGVVQVSRETETESGKPNVSTNRWRLRPLIHVCASNLRMQPDFLQTLSTVFTDCASMMAMMAALGTGSVQARYRRVQRPVRQNCLKW